MTDTKKEYLSLPIIPLVGAADIELGNGQQEMLSKLGKPLYLTFMRALRGRNRLFHYKELVVRFTPGDKVFQIDVLKRYTGTTKEGLGAGSSWEELKTIYPQITYDEDKCIWHVPGIEGLCFDIVRPPKAGEIPLGNRGSGNTLL